MNNGAMDMLLGVFFGYMYSFFLGYKPKNGIV